MKTRPQELREKRDSLMQKSNTHSDSIASQAKLISAGETSELIAQTLSKLQIMENKSEESGWVTKIKAMIGRKTVEEVEGRVHKSAAMGGTVKEVTENLMNIVSNKREAIENVVNDLFDLHDDMTKTYEETDVLIQEIEKDLEENVYEKAEQFNVSTLLAELLEYREIMKENIQSATNTIQAAQVSVHQIVALQPKLQAQLKDGISVLTVLNELKSLNDACSDLEDLSNIIREDNISKAYQAQLDAVDRQNVNKDQILRIENRAKRYGQLQTDVADKMKEVENSTQTRIDVLKRVHESNTLQIENSKQEAPHPKGWFS